MEGVSVGQLCMAGGDREPSKPNELSYKKGDLILILSQLLEDGEHYLASTADGSIGQFPHSDLRTRSPIPMLPMPWFHSTISRLEAEKLLDRNQDGQFLFRTSQNTNGVYALAVSYQGGVKHYLAALDFKNRRVTLNGDVYFDNLPALVEYYKEPSPHLCCPLRVPVVRRSTLEFYIDQEELKRDWGVASQELEMVTDSETLGQGEFGEVRVATYRGTQVAVKYIHNTKQSAAAVSSFLKEATIFTDLRHKNLVQLVGVVFQGSTIQSIVMELMSKGSLQKYLISRGRSVVSQAELLSFVRDVCEGMVYISSKGYVHRDLAARNVLLNSNGQAKVSDFGLLRKANIHVPHEGGKFPVKWTAPEALKESRFSVESDVWSFGVLLWEVFSYGRTPYPSVPTDEVLEMLEDGIVMDPPDNCPEQIYSVMCRCWKMEPSDRPSFPTLQQVLAKSSSDSHTPFGSPMPIRKISTVPEVEVIELVMSQIADKSYQEAPQKRKVTLFLGSLVFLGPQGSGKTSLYRSVTGESFSLTEPLSHLIAIDEDYRLLGDGHGWTRSTAGLMYEHELVRIIVEDLLKHTLSRPTPVAEGVEPTPPPLPPRRVHSFSGAHSYSTTLDPNSARLTNHLSSSSEQLGSSREGPRPQPIAENEGRGSPRVPRSNRKKLIVKLSSSFRAKGHARISTEVRRTMSDATSREYRINVSPAPDSPTSPEPYQSSIPETLIEKVKTVLRESYGGSVPVKHFGKLIDTPGHTAFQSLKPLFITETSLCVLTFDASKDIMSPLSPGIAHKDHKPTSNGFHSNMPSYYQPSGAKYLKNSYLSQIMNEVEDVCLLWSHSASDMTLCGPRIVLVATHSDKVPSTVSHRNFELLQDAVRASPYRKYVTLLKFIVSNSSIIERSSTDDLKHFLMELVKKACRQQIPLKWLRCVRRFQGLSKKGTYFISLSEAKKTISQICDLSDKEEVSRVLHFLHQNHVILQFPRLYHLKDLVITDPLWFAAKLSLVFSTSFADLQSEGAGPELKADQEVLRTKGRLSSQLLGFVWREKSSRVRQEELLTIMSKMDFLCCMTPESHLLPPTVSIGDLTKDKGHKARPSPPFVMVIPALVEEKKPSHLASLPSFNIEPIVFRFKTSHIPSGLFSRLLVRCVQSYPHNYTVYRNAGTFEVDPSSLLMITMETDYFKVSLHKIRDSTVSVDPVPTGMDVTDLDSLLNDPHTPSPDTCLAVLMFVRATLTDLVQQWMPYLDFDLCMSCDCPAHIEDDIDHGSNSSQEESSSRKVSTASNGSIRPKSPGERHYVILNDVESLCESAIKCELGTLIPPSVSLSCWFGEFPNSSTTASPTDDQDLLTDSDLELVVRVLGKSWQELGQTLGFTRKELHRFSVSAEPAVSAGGPPSVSAGELMLRKWQSMNSKSATLFRLLGALEIVQRRDIADDLVAARMQDDGISV